MLIIFVKIKKMNRHDPLPKYLHIPNGHGQFNLVQCRQALISLSDLLKNYSSFVMLENQSYIKIINRYLEVKQFNY